MHSEIPIRCTCGKFKAVIKDVSPKKANHNVCCCSSCQQYAHMLGREGDLLDEHGGTEVFQVSPGTLQFVAGQEELACLQITPKKGALRWYTTCCKTPIAHTLPSYKVPFMAMNHLAIDKKGLQQPLDDYVGPIRARVNGRFSRQQAKELKATVWDLLKMIVHFTPLTLKWTFRGEYKRSPFFDSQTQKPILPPSRSIGKLPQGTKDSPSNDPSQSTSNSFFPIMKKKMGCG